MVTAKIIRFEISYPIFSAFVNFSDDKYILSQPQVIQIPFSGDELTNLTNDTLYSKIQEYINQYENILSKTGIFDNEIGKEITKDGEVIK